MMKLAVSHIPASMDDWDAVSCLVVLLNKLKLVNHHAKERLANSNYWSITVRVKGYDAFRIQANI